MPDRSTEPQLVRVFDPPFEIVAMHGHPVVIEDDGVLRSIVCPEAVPFVLPLKELAGDALAADRRVFVPGPCLVGRMEDRVVVFEHGAFPLPLC